MLEEVRKQRLQIHAVVGQQKIELLRGVSDGASVVAPHELPNCDVLELDCEGAELEIINQMTIRPRTVLVESHGVYGATTERVKSILQNRGYSVINEAVADDSQREYCIENDIMALEAIAS